MALLVIFLGGGVGSVARYALAEVFPLTNFPFATLLTNLLGCLLLGFLIAIVKAKPTLHRLTRPALGTGLLGGFTTFSTFAFQSYDLSAPLAATYVAVSVLGGLVSAEFGEILAEWLILDTSHRFAVPSDVAQPGLVLDELDVDPDLP
jgi:CrcB protein